MLSSMNKKVGMLTLRDLSRIEKREHGLKSAPSVGKMRTLEMKEHGLKQKPGLGDMIRMEQKEHMRDGQIVIGRGKEKSK
jgi:hypothetical protein